MQMSTLVFDKRQRRMISDLIRGLNDGCPPVANYTTKVQEKLAERDIIVKKDTIGQQMYWATNNQDTYRAAYQVLLVERPDQLKNLFNGQQLMALQPVEPSVTIEFFNKSDNEPYKRGSKLPVLAD